jgi:hypothetical protein
MRAAPGLVKAVIFAGYGPAHLIEATATAVETGSEVKL